MRTTISGPELTPLCDLKRGGRFRFPETKEGTFFTVIDPRPGSFSAVVASNRSTEYTTIFKDALVITL